MDKPGTMRSMVVASGAAESPHPNPLPEGEGTSAPYRDGSGNRSFITHASHSFLKASMSSRPKIAFSVL